MALLPPSAREDRPLSRLADATEYIDGFIEGAKEFFDEVRNEL